MVARDALLREQMQGGQSFVVCPRIADLQPMRERLAELVPELDVALAHGRMKADTLDETMVAFADGAHDVLLTTNIIEAGLDIPSANTMLVWRPDRFGLAELASTARPCRPRTKTRHGLSAAPIPQKPLPPGNREAGADASDARRAGRRLRHRRARSRSCAAPAICSAPSSRDTCG